MFRGFAASRVRNLLTAAIGRINDATTHDSLHDLCIGDLIFWNFQQIAIEHDEVRQFTDHERAGLGVLVQFIR